MKFFIVPILLIVACVFFGCKKNNDSPSSSKSQWTIMGKTYLADTTYFNNDPFEMDLEAHDTAGNVASVTFRYRPIANGTFTVRDATTITDAPDLDSSQCVINATYNVTNYYYSAGTLGNIGTASVTLSGNKLNITFSNIKVKNAFDATDSTVVSGSFHEQ